MSGARKMDHVDAGDLREALQRLQLVTDNMPAAVTQCSRGLCFLWVSRSYAALLGEIPEQIIGRSILDVLGPDAFEIVRPHIEKVLSGERVEYETQLNHGGVGKRWIHAVYVPTKDEDEQVDGWIAVITDITDRHEAERRFRLLADTAPVMVWVSGPDKLCTFFNNGWLEYTGRTMAQELGNGWASGVHADDLERCFAVYTSCFDARQSFQMEYRLRRADGEYRWILDRGVPLFGQAGVFQGYIGSCIDITDLRRAQQEALARQKLESLGALASGIAHDFNNLLGGVLVSAELLLTAFEEGPDHIEKEEILRIKTAAIRGAEIVQQLMIYGVEEAEGFEVVDLCRLVGEMLALLKVSVSKHARLRASLPEKLSPVRANAAQIRQVVMNLITNASDALGDEDGDISVAVSQVRASGDSIRTDHLRLEVRDTGCGMNEETKAKIFDPFFTTKSAGHGLGLSAVQGAIRAHGGTITVGSEPGQGSCFEVLLPCSTAEHRESAILVEADQAGGLTGTVLVVEDEEALRVAVSKGLRREGFTVIEAPDGKTALGALRGNLSGIDVVLLDLTLPGMAGHEILREMRRIVPEIRVIITSAYSEGSSMAAFGEPRPLPYIRKPYSLAELKGLLRLVCSSKERQAAS